MTTKLEKLKTEAIKATKCSGSKGYEAVDILADYARVLRNEMAERVIVSLFLWSMAGLMFYFGYKTKTAPNPIEFSGSGADQTVSFKGVLDFNTLGGIIMLLPFAYMMARKFKGREKTVYVKEN